MADRPVVVSREALYRETRTSAHGDELRCIVTREALRHPATGRVEHRAVVRHPGIVVIVALVPPDRVLLLRQYRHAVDADLWEVPAGTLHGREEDGRVVATESPVECAARELEEETGWIAGDLEQLGTCHPMPGMTDEVLHVFVARNLSPGRQALDPGEMISEVRPVPLAALPDMVARGEITDGKTIVALYYASRAMA
jgi:ADP-ribose pyrophosphatase